MKKVIIVLLLALSSSVSAQIDEKASQNLSNSAPIETLEAAAPFFGSLAGAPTYNRIFASGPFVGCDNPSTFSATGIGISFALVPIYSPTGATLVASLDNPGTDIGDPVLSVYCDPFDESDASLNLAGYNDDFFGLISAFDGSEGIVLEPNTQYFMVVSLFAPGSIGGGNFELTVGATSPGEDVLFGSPASLSGTQPIPVNNPALLALLIALMAGLGVFAVRRFA